MRRSGTSSRSVDALLTDFGARLPRVQGRPTDQEAEKLFPRVAKPRGVRKPGHGWSPTQAPLAGFHMTSEQTPVLWPIIAGAGLPPTGAPMGFNVLSGGTFYCDPMGWVADDSIPVTNPNVFIFGKPGRGKSALVKAFMLRMIRFGYRSLVLGDVKDEYEDISRALGVDPFRIGPGLPGRINPLDLGPLALDWERLDRAEVARRGALAFNRWLALLRGLVGSQHVPFTPSEARVVSQVLRDLTGWSRGNARLTPVTIPSIWQAMSSPSPDLIETCRYASEQEFFAGTRLLRDALGALCEGELEGLFDGPSTFEPNWRAPIQTLSLQPLHAAGNEAAVGIALMCLNSWGQGIRELADDGDRRIVLRDEAWMQTRLGVEAVKTLDSSLRLSRNDGDIQLVTYHKPSDPLSAGDSGSQAAQIAKDLLHLADVRVLMGQDEEVGTELGHLLGLTNMQRGLVTGWAMQGKGRALWMVGDQRYKVQTILTPVERQLTYTNDAIA